MIATSMQELKPLVEFMDRLIEEDFKSKYKEIYLLNALQT